MPEAGRALRLGVPNPKQLQFFLATAPHVGFGGARGGGKSWAVRKKAVLLALRWPGIKVLIVRRTYPELQANHISYLEPELAGVARYSRTERRFCFAGGSSIAFGYCDADSDLLRYQGAEYDVLFLDEATQLEEGWIRRITACCRGVNAFPKRVYYTCNPGGPGHTYLKRLFIDRCFEPGERAEDYVFIRSLVGDNAALLAAQPDYVHRLEALPPALRAAWLYGDWNLPEGRFFEEFRSDPAHFADRRHTHVIAAFAPPASWPLVRSYDFGYAKPFSCAWWAVDEDGRAYRILELYGCTKTPNEGLKWSPDRQFAEIARIEREHPWLAGRSIQGVADPAIFDASRGESIAETAARRGIYFAPGDNRRIAGWMQLHGRLAFDEHGLPMLYVFENCRAFIRTLPTLTFSSASPEDLDTRGEDHAADEARYFCMSRPLRARAAPPGPGLPADDPLGLAVPRAENPFRAF